MCFCLQHKSTCPKQPPKWPATPKSTLLRPRSLSSAFGSFWKSISASVNKCLQASSEYHRTASREQEFLLQKNHELCAGLDRYPLGRALWGGTLWLGWRRSIFSPTVVPNLTGKLNILHVTSLFLLECIAAQQSRVMWNTSILIKSKESDMIQCQTSQHYSIRFYLLNS